MTEAAIAKSNLPDKQNIEDFLRSVALFSGFSQNEIAPFILAAKARHYPKNKLLFLHGDEAEYIYVVLDGWVKLFRETLDGNEAVIDILTTRNVFGETSVFDHGHYDVSAQVVEDATLISLPTSLLKEAVNQSQQLAVNMLAAMSRHRRHQDHEIEHLTVQNAPQRIGCFLLKLCLEQDENPITLHLPYDKTLIASRLGMKPETFSRALATLKQETGIGVKGATVLIHDLEKLANYCCGACSSTYPCEQHVS